MLKLYYSPGACSLSPHIALLELGLPHEHEKVDLKKKTTESGQDYMKVNPKGSVPALEVAPGDVLTEGPAILAYLTSQKPGLTPEPGSREYFHYLEWVTFINSEIHKAFGPLFHGGDDKARQNLEKKLALAAELLGDRQHLAGDSFSAADGYLYVVLRWADKFDITLPPALQAFRDRVDARPKVQQALKSEGLQATAS